MYELLRKGFKKKILSKRQNINRPFLLTHYMVFSLHFLFALYAVGNIEFMIMFPILIVFTFLLEYRFNTKILSLFAFTLFIWNFTYAVLPNHIYNYFNDEQLLSFIEKNPDKLFLVKNADLKNKYYYKSGFDDSENIIISHTITSKKEIDSILRKRGEFYTDIIDKPAIFNRAQIISSGGYIPEFKSYKKTKVYTYKGLYGITTVYKIQAYKFPMK